MGDRALFPTLSARAYLCHAAISPVSAPVQRRVEEVLADYAQEGVRAFPAWAAQRERLRSKLATLVGGEAHEVGLVANTTTGVSCIAHGLPWRPGDRIVLFRGEFPANVTPWLMAAQQYGLEPVWLDADAYRLDVASALQELERTLARGVRLVAVSAVQFQSGLRMPLAKIGALCQRHGAELFVDAIQCVGVAPLDVTGCQIDYLSCGSHKWLMGLEGAAFLYVAQRRARSLVPRLAGWLSHREGTKFLFEGSGWLRYDRPFRQEASVFEGATTNAIGFAALEASTDIIQQLGVDAIFEHVSRYLDSLESQLVARGFESLRCSDEQRRSGLLSVRPPFGDVVGWHRELGQHGVLASLPDGCLRFSPHWPNAPVEIEAVVGAIDAVAQTIER